MSDEIQRQPKQKSGDIFDDPETPLEWDGESIYRNIHGWYWVDETGLPDGPHDTKETARRILKEYCRDILGS